MLSYLEFHQSMEGTEDMEDGTRRGLREEYKE